VSVANGNGSADHGRVKAAIEELRARATANQASIADDLGKSEAPNAVASRATLNPADDAEILNKLARTLEDPKENRNLGASAGKTTAPVPYEEVFGEGGKSGASCIRFAQPLLLGGSPMDGDIRKL
jgi:hypothetical protein